MANIKWQERKDNIQYWISDGVEYLISRRGYFRMNINIRSEGSQMNIEYPFDIGRQL